MSTQPRIEVVTYRDPDAATELAVYVDGAAAVVEWVDIDPGAGHTLADWREDALTALAGASPAAAEEIAAAYQRGEATGFVDTSRERR